MKKYSAPCSRSLTLYVLGFSSMMRLLVFACNITAAVYARKGTMRSCVEYKTNPNRKVLSLLYTD